MMMSAMAPDVLLDLLECVAAFGRSLPDRFDPRFLAEFSARVQRLVPHDYIAIARREDDGQTCSVFAEYAVRSALLGHGGHDTPAFERGDRLPAEAFALTRSSRERCRSSTTSRPTAVRTIPVPREGRGVRAAARLAVPPTPPGASSAR
jgi:hypothetical protein